MKIKAKVKTEAPEPVKVGTKFKLYSRFTGYFDVTVLFESRNFVLAKSDGNDGSSVYKITRDAVTLFNASGTEVTGGYEFYQYQCKWTATGLIVMSKEDTLETPVQGRVYSGRNVVYADDNVVVYNVVSTTSANVTHSIPCVLLANLPWKFYMIGEVHEVDNKETFPFAWVQE